MAETFLVDVILPAGADSTVAKLTKLCEKTGVVIWDRSVRNFDAGSGNLRCRFNTAQDRKDFISELRKLGIDPLPNKGFRILN